MGLNSNNENHSIKNNEDNKNSNSNDNTNYYCYSGFGASGAVALRAPLLGLRVLIRGHWAKRPGICLTRLGFVFKGWCNGTFAQLRP